MYAKDCLLIVNIETAVTGKWTISSSHTFLLYYETGRSYIAHERSSYLSSRRLFGAGIFCASPYSFWENNVATKCYITAVSSYLCILDHFQLQPHKVFILLSRRGTTEHSSTRPRFSTHNLLIVFECMYIDCK
jgi:hypothetical protein